MPSENQAPNAPEPQPRNPLDRRGFFREVFGTFVESAESASGDKSIGKPRGDPAESSSAEVPLEKRPMERRGLFKEAVRSVLEPAAEFVREKLEAFDIAPRAYVPPEPERFLRPPGAGFEHIFRTTCARSGKCVQACPVRAIKVMHTEDSTSDGTPYIVPSMQACVVCDGLECMRACPSGALNLVPKAEIRMGLAVMRYHQCLRSKGEDCRICVNLCPIGSNALIINEDRVEVLVSGCVGCGVCEQQCPTSPKAIIVEPN